LSSKPIRNPLFPGASQDEILRVEAGGLSRADKAAKERRLQFAKLQSEQIENGQTDPNNNADSEKQDSKGNISAFGAAGVLKRRRDKWERK